MGLFDGPKNKGAAKFSQALDGINRVTVPTIEEQRVQLEQLVQQGKITPEEMELYLQEDSGLNGIQTDPRFKQAQVNALEQLQTIGAEGGLTAIDKARLGEITDAQNAEERGSREAIEQNARERGIGGSDFTLASKLIANQEAANRASKEGLGVAALAEQRVLDAIQAAGNMGGQMDAAEFEKQARIEAAQDAINQFNTANRQQTGNANVQNRNIAQATNLNEKQRVADTNVTNSNANRTRNADLIAKKFQQEMDKATAAASVLTGWGGADQKVANDRYASQMGMVGTAAGVAGTMAAGPMGGAAASSSVSNIGGGNTTNSQYKNPYALPSDVTNKEDIAPADIDLDKFMESLQPYKYKYKDKMKMGDGEQHGVMAQDLAKTPTGAAIVEQTPEGLAIDTKKGFGVLAAAIGRLNKKIGEKV